MTGFHSFRTFCFAGLFAFALAGMLIVSVPLAAWQGSNGAGYRVPPKSIADLVDAPLTPVMRVGPNQQWMLLMMRPSLPSIEELSQPESRIAGLRINPRTNGPSRARFSFSGLVLQRVSGGEGIPVKGIPAGTRIGNVSWSPDGVHIAFTVTGDEGVELWVAEAASAEARRLLDARVSAAYGGSFAWLADSQTLFVKTVPAGHGAPPEQPRVPAGPILQENTGRKAPARTYQDLLKSAYDEELFEYFTTAQVVRVTLAGESQPIGRAGIVRSMSPSPDGKYLLVQTIQRPFSYLVPAGRFPYRVEVWDGDGNVVKQIADRPLADNVPVPFGSVPTGPRSFGWRSDTPATLYWTEAQDGGDAGKKAEVRDRVYTSAAPFTGEPQPLSPLGLRLAGIHWSCDDLALVNEFWWRARKRRIWRVRPGQLGTAPELLFELATEDRYNDPGSPATRRNAAGKTVLRTGMAGQVLFFLGQGASPEGNRPFLDERNLITGEIRRLWRSEAPYYERVVDLLNLEEGLMLTSRESVNEPPNYFVRNLRSGELSRLTRFPHPTPQLTGVHKELIKYPRADGVNLSGTLYLPPGKKPADGPFPVLMWAYPREYKDAASAGQVRRSPYRFVRISPTGSLIYLAAGYAIFDDPIMPIIGEGDTEPNDSYVKQLVSSAKAAVNVLVERGIAERGHIAIAGHSYGAFMVANLLAHSDLFAAGIARSGAYNRTLTPFGFQAEQRTFWQAPEIYFRMSPFMHADKVNEPILLIHGEADNNSGTFPIQSRRFYHALKGHGATARLVMLPHESHGYRGRESVLHMLWETVEWLDRYVGGQ